MTIKSGKLNLEIQTENKKPLKLVMSCNRRSLYNPFNLSSYFDHLIIFLAENKTQLSDLWDFIPCVLQSVGPFSI